MKSLLALICHVLLVHAASEVLQQQRLTEVDQSRASIKTGEAHHQTSARSTCINCDDGTQLTPEVGAVAEVSTWSSMPTTLEISADSFIPTEQPSEVHSDLPSELEPAPEPEPFPFISYQQSASQFPSVSPGDSTMPSVSFEQSESLTPSHGMDESESFSHSSSDSSMPSMTGMPSMNTESHSPTSFASDSSLPSSRSIAVSSAPTSDNNNPTLPPTCIECDDYPYLTTPKGPDDAETDSHMPSTTGMPFDSTMPSQGPSNMSSYVPSVSSLPSVYHFDSLVPSMNLDVSNIPSGSFAPSISTSPALGDDDDKENRGRDDSPSSDSPTVSSAPTMTSMPSFAPSNAPSELPSVSPTKEESVGGSREEPQPPPPPTPNSPSEAVTESSNGWTLSKPILARIVALSTGALLMA